MLYLQQGTVFRLICRAFRSQNQAGRAGTLGSAIVVITLLVRRSCATFHIYLSSFQGLHPAPFVRQISTRKSRAVVRVRSETLLTS